MSARKLFKVLAPGIATDGTTYEGEPIEFHFSKNEKLVVGDKFTAEFSETRIDSSTIFVESGPSAGKERKEFESAGPDRAGSWRPQGTPDRGRGTPDSGRFSHRGPEHVQTSKVVLP
jgi:hypothetical protein